MSVHHYETLKYDGCSSDLARFYLVDDYHSNRASGGGEWAAGEKPLLVKQFLLTTCNLIRLGLKNTLIQIRLTIKASHKGFYIKRQRN